MKLGKESKIRVLENFYALDYVLLGKPAKKLTEACCPAIVDEYISIKGALLSVMIEMFKLVDHQPAPFNEKVDVKNLSKMARGSAKIAREMCQKLVASPKGRAELKATLRETVAQEEGVDVEQTVKEQIRQKAFSLAIDHLLVARTISESKNFKQLNEWEGRIIEDAYKILRDSLVENAILILDNAD